jgi:diguanylate cyclase (GGDEF)-like protein
MKPDVQRRLERCTNLPSLPWVALKTLELCESDELDLGEIAAVIGRDPALAAKLIRTANSPLFAIHGEVTSIAGAVSLLGLNAVRTLVLSFSLLRDSKPGAQAGLKDYWRRSLLSAVAGRELGAGLGADHDEAFLCCLLQDIGMLALSRSLGADYAAVLAGSDGDHDRLIELERREFDTDHAQTGAWLLERWNVPRRLPAAVRASHEGGPPPAAPEAGPAATMASIVRLSGRFADLWVGDLATARNRLAAEVRGHWPPGAIRIDEIQAALVGQTPHIGPLFEVHLDPEEMAGVLAQAQEAIVAQSVRTTREIQEMHAALARLESRTAALLAEAHTDPLTGLANRGYTETYLGQVFYAATESRRLIGVLYIDIDHFKKINDRYGHAAGDSVLRSIALCMRTSIRGGDFIGRYAGDEFLVILRADHASEAETVAERIRRAIEDTPHPLGHGRTARLTASVGSALLDVARHETPEQLLEEADQSLYAAKRSGRNKVVSKSDSLVVTG